MILLFRVLAKISLTSRDMTVIPKASKKGYPKGECVTIVIALDFILT